MSCFHPFLGRPDRRAGLNPEGKYRYQIYGWYDPSIAQPQDIKIPCGKCIGCRLDYSRQWADRMMLELDHSKKAIFATLTYNNENVPMVVDDYDCPLGLTLWKPDLQDFMKRLRSRLKFEGREIRFYGSGEYGSHTRRPHYHLIIFGVCLEDFGDRVPKGQNELGQNYYISEEFSGIWSKGFTLITAVSWNTFAYVSRYVMKKAYADDVQEFQVPEFSLMSRRPGLGAYYFDEHPDCVDFSSIYLRSKDGSVKVGIPKYFLNKLKQFDSEKYDQIMLARKEFASDAQMLELSKTDLSFLEYIEVKEQECLDRVDILRKIRK